MNWSPQQTAALKAFKIPVYQRLNKESQDTHPSNRQGVPKEEPVVDQPKTPATQQEASEPQSTYYQVGVWTLFFPHEVPVPRYQWLDDLSKAFDTRPTQINKPNEDSAVIDCAAYAKAHLSKQEKQTLWAQLKPYLQS